MQVKPGDTIEIPSNKVDVPPRRGKAERIIQEDPLKLEVRWEDDHISILEPAGGTLRVVESD